MSKINIDKSLNQQIGKKLRIIRLRCQYTQQNVAYDINISPTAYSKMENGKTDFTVTRLKQLSEYFNIYLPDFFDENIEFPRLISEVIAPEEYSVKLKEVEAQKNVLQEIIKERIR